MEFAEATTIDDKVAIARVVNTACSTVLNMKIRADEGSLKRQTLDRLPELLKIIAEEEAKLPR